jgi:tRNA nucleotidyltransferase (CCA-adding enzyme)
MFLDLDGTVTDYFNGIEDLKNRKIRFVGQPDKRIKEDYLRILRYFRFFGRVADDQSILYDDETFEAIKNNADGLASSFFLFFLNSFYFILYFKEISAERKWYEFKKILIQKHADRILKAFYDTKIAVHLGKIFEYFLRFFFFLITFF